MATSFWALVLLALLFAFAALTAKFAEIKSARVSIRHVQSAAQRERARGRR
jgi:hypothetical protein